MHATGIRKLLQGLNKEVIQIQEIFRYYSHRTSVNEGEG